jgi:hypothetical protein
MLKSLTADFVFTSRQEGEREAPHDLRAAKAVFLKCGFGGTTMDAAQSAHACRKRLSIGILMTRRLYLPA